MGGIDPCTLDRDPVRHLDIVFGLAEKSRSVIHLRTRGWGVQASPALAWKGVTISHGYGSGAAELLRTFPPPGGAGSAPALPLQQLVEAGVRVGLGEDGQDAGESVVLLVVEPLDLPDVAGGGRPRAG